MGFWSELWEAIKEAIKKVWNYLKKITVEILNFFNNIVSWFKVPKRWQKLLKDKDKIAIAYKANDAIKEKIAKGDYKTVDVGLYDHAVVVGLYDQKTGELLEEDTVVIQANELDEETAKHFRDEDLLILK